jgi:hypothetical protein
LENPYRLKDTPTHSKTGFFSSITPAVFCRLFNKASPSGDALNDRKFLLIDGIGESDKSFCEDVSGNVLFDEEASDSVMLGGNDGRRSWYRWLSLRVWLCKGGQVLTKASDSFNNDLVRMTMYVDGEEKGLFIPSDNCQKHWMRQVKVYRCITIAKLTTADAV